MTGRFGTGIRGMVCGLLALGCLWLAGCGMEEDRNTAGDGTSPSEDAGGQAVSVEESVGTAEKADIADIRSRREGIFGQEEGMCIGLQYFQGEALRFRLVDNTKYIWAEEGATEPVTDYSAEVYLDREDGSSELLVADLAPTDSGADQTLWYLARDGSIYCLETAYEQRKYYIAKRDSQGALLYERQLDMQARDICQLADGSIILLLDEGGGFNSLYRLGRLDPETGAVDGLTQISMETGDSYIAAGREGLLVLSNAEGLREIRIEDGKQTPVLTFNDTSYVLSDWREVGLIADMRMLEDGSAEFLWEKGQQCTRESLAWTSIDKIPVVMRGFHFNNGWIKNAVAEFNRQSDTYYVTLEGAGEDWDDFAAQTSVQIASGKGPDLLYGEVLTDYIQGMIDKGGFEDLAPYMEASGIREEDYFPMAFGSWRMGEKIYGINASMCTYSYSMDASVTGGEQVQDIGTLVDALYAYDGEAMYMVQTGAGGILMMFLEGSEDLWGMLDWEAGTCDFGGELFAKMLEVAGRYAYDENQDYPILASWDSGESLYSFYTPEHLKEMGRVQVGVMFPDGCHAGVNSAYQILAINANSNRKQGAWEFIAFLLGEERQKELPRDDATPVNRKAFQAMIDSKLEYLENGNVMEIGQGTTIRGQFVETMHRKIADGDITDEWVEAFTRAAEEARCLPIRTKAVLEIVAEEAKDYFNGMKSVDEVVRVIENRVGIYMNE